MVVSCRGMVEFMSGKTGRERPSVQAPVGKCRSTIPLMRGGAYAGGLHTAGGHLANQPAHRKSTIVQFKEVLQRKWDGKSTAMLLPPPFGSLNYLQAAAGVCLLRNQSTILHGEQKYNVAQNIRTLLGC